MNSGDDAHSPQEDSIADLDRRAEQVAAVAAVAGERARRRVPLKLAPAAAAFAALVALVAGALVAILTVSDAHWLGVMLLVVVVLNAALYGVAVAAKRFRWYGIAVFLSIPLFGAALGAARTYRFPKLQPVALIRKSSDRAICGIYVAETNDRVYVARIELAGGDDPKDRRGSGRIFWVPESDVDMIKIGAPQSIGDANGRAPLLARELYGDRAERVPEAAKPTVTGVQSTSGRRVTTTTTEAPVAPGKLAIKRLARKDPEDACTHVSLADPLPAARGGVAGTAERQRLTPPSAR